MTNSRSLRTKDGVHLSYTTTGPTTSRNILFLPGWRQTAEQWRKQVDYFRTKYCVTTFDYRGHGESDKPESGYTVQLLASDLNDLLSALDLQDVSLVCHSMGCSVALAWLKHFPESKGQVKGIILADLTPCMLIDPSWTEIQTKEFGGFFTTPQLDELDESFSTFAPALIRAMHTPSISEEDLSWVLAQNAKCPDKIALELLKDHTMQDWRSVLPSLDIRTLLVAGEASVVSVETAKWIQSQVPGSQSFVFGKNEGGSHFSK